MDVQITDTYSNFNNLASTKKVLLRVLRRCMSYGWGGGEKRLFFSKQKYTIMCDSLITASSLGEN